MVTTLNPSDQSITQYNVLTGGASNLINNVTPGASGTILQSAGASSQPAYTTATYPATTTANQILYSSAANTVAGITTANSGVLVTSSAGVPSIDTTDFQVLSTGLQLKGNNTNTAPPAGFIGEQIRSFVNSGSPVSMSTGIAANITSITLTAGIWDISGIITYSAAAGTSVTQSYLSIGTTSATLDGANGDSLMQFTHNAIVNLQNSISLPAFRVTLSGSTTYYLVGQTTFTISTRTAWGRLSATRVG